MQENQVCWSRENISKMQSSEPGAGGRTYSSGALQSLSLRYGFLQLFQKKLTGSTLILQSVLICFLPNWREHSLEACRYSSPFCPRNQRHPRQWEFVLLLQNWKCSWHGKASDAAVTTGFDRCCHPVNTIFVVLRFPLFYNKRRPMWEQVLYQQTDQFLIFSHFFLQPSLKTSSFKFKVGGRPDVV